jgi:hypothetical protein
MAGLGPKNSIFVFNLKNKQKLFYESKISLTIPYPKTTIFIILPIPGHIFSSSNVIIATLLIHFIHSPMQNILPNNRFGRFLRMIYAALFAFHNPNTFGFAPLPARIKINTRLPKADFPFNQGNW